MVISKISSGNVPVRPNALVVRVARLKAKFQKSGLVQVRLPKNLIWLFGHCLTSSQVGWPFR